MVHISIFALALAAASSSVNGAPFMKRIAQVISDSTTQWEKACDAAGGGQQCNTVAVNSFGTLLANAGPCDQQNAADNMVDLAKQLNNDPNTIKFAQIFAQQPRNSPNSQSIPYCQQAPRNAELNGLFQCQFQGDSKTFVGGLTAGQPGTVPLGQSSPLNPPGSCPANPSGPIADGTQLVDLTQNPGVGNAGSSTTNSGSGNSTTGNSTSSSGNSTVGTGSSGSSTSAAPVSSASSTASGSGPAGGSSSCGAPPAGSASGASASGGSNLAVASPSAASAAPVASASSGSGGFQLQNGQAAQKLNAQFASLSASSSCQEGEQACVNGGFAQCVGGSFQMTSCGSGLTCAALPLVNKAGTSITCTTQADAQRRIQATGATGGVTGNGA